MPKLQSSVSSYNSHLEHKQCLDYIFDQFNVMFNVNCVGIRIPIIPFLLSNY